MEVVFCKYCSEMYQLKEPHECSIEYLREDILSLRNRNVELSEENKKLVENTIEKIISESEMVIDDINGDYFKLKKSLIRDLLTTKEG